jgi:hypothetical protein
MRMMNVIQRPTSQTLLTSPLAQALLLILSNKARKVYAHKENKELPSSKFQFNPTDKENNAMAANKSISYEEDLEVSIST